MGPFHGKKLSAAARVEMKRRDGRVTPSRSSSSRVRRSRKTAFPNCASHPLAALAGKRQGVVVVRPGWVIESCREGRKLPCEPHALPPFEGLRITATGLSLGE